jgi:hypothetical protein
MNTLGLQIRQFFRQPFEVDDHAGAENVGGLGIEYAGRKEVQLEGAELVDHGVAGVVAALKADTKSADWAR